MPTTMLEMTAAQENSNSSNIGNATTPSAIAPGAAAGSNATTATASSQGGTDASSSFADDAEAREWWAQREAKVERELYSGLLKRMDTQRKQVIAFKAEQSKWENRLQVKIKKDAHDRKLLGEYNLELQAALTAFEDKFAYQQREVDAQTTHIIALESQLLEKAAETHELERLQQRNHELSQEVAQWQQFHRAEAAAAKATRERDHEELLNHVAQSLEATTLADLTMTSSSSTNSSTSHNGKLPSRRRSAPAAGSSSAVGSSDSADDSDALLLARVAELEKLCKQKDQAIQALKSMFERQEVVLDAKLKLTAAKYDQVKAINVALQTRLLAMLPESATAA